MKLICPACNSRLTLPDGRVPAGGAWARCPKCHDRFFIPPVNQTIDFQQPEAVRPQRITVADDEARRKILARARLANGLNGEPRPDDFDLDAVHVVYPELQNRPVIRNTVIALLTAAPLLFIVLAFKASSAIPLTPAQPAVLTVSTDEVDDSEKLIQNDLISLRRKMMRMGRFKAGAEAGGAELRVFYYFMDRLAPGACREISYIETSSGSAVDGFLAKATCTENIHKTVEMQVTWPDNIAVVTFPAREGRLEIDLSPPPRTRPPARETVAAN